MNFHVLTLFPEMIEQGVNTSITGRAINNGLLLIEQPDLHDDMKEGDTVTVVMNEHVDYNGKQYPIASLPENLMSIIQAGGLVKAMRKLNGLD